MNKKITQEAVWCFKRWSRKPWAAFAGLCRFEIGRLGVRMSIILLATPVIGAQIIGEDPQKGVPRTVHIDTVAVTAISKAALQRSLVSQTRTIVERKAFAPTQTAESVLRLLPAVDIRERAGKSPQADISIRGGAFDGTMVMLNGINFSDARTGHQSHSLPVDLDIISEIAVVDWAAGAGALSGGVDFQTAIPARDFLRFRAEGGAHGYGYGNLSGALQAGELSLLAVASYKRSDGYRHNTDFRNANGYVRAQWHGWDFQAGIQQREWGSNGFYSLRYPDQFEHTATGLASLRFSETWNRFGLETSASVRRNDDRFEMERRDPSSIPFNFHTTWALSGDAAGSYDFGRAGVASAGIGVTRHTMESSSMGGHDRNVLSVWAGHNKSWRRTWLRATANLTDSRYGSEGTFNAEAGWRVSRGVSLRTNAMRSMRLPTFTDLFYNVATYHPNPNLRPEQAMTWRLSAQVASGAFSMESAAWYRLTRNVIDWEQREDGDWYSTQLGRLGTVGVEASGTFTIEGLLRVAMLNYGYTNSDMRVAAGYISKYALDYMRHKVSAVVGFGAGEFTLSFTGSFYDRVGSYVDALGAVKGYKPYFLLDGRLSWERSRQGSRGGGLQIYADATNITGTRYFDFGGLPMPRQWLSGGVVITIAER